MIEMTLQNAAKNCHAILDDQNCTANQTIKQVSTDSRKSIENSLFIALKGENFNGHQFVSAAEDNGAVACLIDEDVETNLAKLVVSDTCTAMGELASSVREDLAVPCVGITGSCGKTTVKEMIASILSVNSKVLATEGNYNNAVGVPLTLFRLTSEHQFAVIEMGASKSGDIDQIARWVKPEVAVITNISEAHLQGLGDLDGVATVKGELLTHLSANGTAVLNHDSQYLKQWESNLKDSQSVVTVSAKIKDLKSINDYSAEQAIDETNQADYFATDLQLHEIGGSSFIAHTPFGEQAINIGLSGKHNVNNALMAMAASLAMGATLEQCRLGLKQINAVKGRLEILDGILGSRIINDSYNANPASLKAAMQTLISFKGNHLLILGDMAELGASAEAAHREAGETAKSLGIKVLFATGELSLHTVEGFGEGAEYFESKEILAKSVIQKLQQSQEGSWNLLIKGSRSAAMEELLEPLVNPMNQKVQENATNLN